MKTTLTPREKETLELYEKTKKKNPGLRNEDILKLAKIAGGTLHSARKKMGLLSSAKKNKPGPKPGSKKVVVKKPTIKIHPVMHTLKVPDTVAPQNIVVMVCSASSLREVLNAIN